MEEKLSCIVCGSRDRKIMFTKQSGSGASFTLVKCKTCGLQYIFPRPSESQMEQYYGSSYFTTRTDRGYNNYFSSSLRKEIERVIALNLEDLKFFEFESRLASPKRSLDIGCAAGYFVNYLKSREWEASGIDVSGECVKFAKDSLNLDVTHGNYLDKSFKNKFNLVTLWATIEHLHHPESFLEKIREDMADDGLLYLSTCRTGILNFMFLFGKRWRYYNFPEHLYFFSFPALKKLLYQKGFEVIDYKTYGSGVGKAGSILKKTADFSAKNFYLGDMMLISARKTG